MQRHPNIKDSLNLIIFAVCVAVGTIFINSFIFRSFSVVGPSMEPTMHTGDRLIVNRVPVTIQNLKNELYLPKRGQVIVFENPLYNKDNQDEYIVKRVIAFPGERVTLQDGNLTVYNDDNPSGFNPDLEYSDTLGLPTSGEFDGEVPKGTLFVAGDHRNENYSFDSRNGLGFVPLHNVVGPVSLRIWPFSQIDKF